MTSEQKASAVSPEMSELDVLAGELTGLEDLSEEEKVNESEKRKNWETEQDRIKAQDMRKSRAMEKLRKQQTESSRKKMNQGAPLVIP